MAQPGSFACGWKYGCTVLDLVFQIGAGSAPKWHASLAQSVPEKLKLHRRGRGGRRGFRIFPWTYPWRTQRSWRWTGL